MDRIRIHGTDLEVSQICFGQVGLGLRPDEAEGMRLLDIFASLGGNFVDTASVYSNWVPGELHRSERILGDYFGKRGNRDQFIVCTKGCHYDLETKADRVTPADFMADLEASLKMLRTDRIDLYLFHRDDMRMPVASLLEVCEKARAEGKIRYYGASNWRVQRLTAADKAAQERGFEGFRVNQLTTHPAVGLTNPLPDDTMTMWNRNYAGYHRSTGMAVMGSSSLAEGFFSDPDNERFAGTMYDTGAARLLAKKVLGLSRETGLTPAQICIRFQTDYPGIRMIPVFSASSEKNLRELCSSFDKPFPQDALFRF
jgi:aryl-alcohol dehydrogenase-like predicted oxidoreductase